MKNFPMFLQMAGRRVVLCGGGEEVARKARLILKTEAEIVLLADDLDAELSALVASGRARHVTSEDGVFDGAVLVFIGTDDDDRDLRLARAARAAGAVVNVIDKPELCDAFTPSIVDRDPLVVAIGTEGAGPVLGRAVKTEIETMLPPRLGGFVALAGRLRDAVAEAIAPTSRRAFWEWAFGGEPLRLHLAGRETDAATMLREAIDAGRAPEAKGHIALVGAGPGARDLLTLRAVQRMQQADVIYYDSQVDPEVLELARRDADRVRLALPDRARDAQHDAIDQQIRDAARSGQRVVRLTAGDPSVFGAACRALAVAQADGIETEIVPGISTASAAMASARLPLAEGGEFGLSLVATGPCGVSPVGSQTLSPGTAIAFTTGACEAAQIAAELQASGVPAECPVDLLSQISGADERHIETTLGAVADALRDQRLSCPSVMMVRYPAPRASRD